jgi:hypothetical protein
MGLVLCRGILAHHHFIRLLSDCKSLGMTGTPASGPTLSAAYEPQPWLPHGVSMAFRQEGPILRPNDMQIHQLKA